jgi:Domain of unknown function (DUF4091)/Family of unknown function (DUF6067)
MKQIFRILLALGAFATLSPAAELAPNSGFEDAAGPANAPFPGWSFYGGFEHGAYSIARSREAHAGQNACQITCNKKGRAGLSSAPVQLEPGTVIEVSCWIKAAEATGGRIFLNFEGTPGDGWASKDLQTGTYEWMRFTQRAVVPQSKTGGAQSIVVYLYTSCAGSIWVDDFSIQSLDAKALAAAPAAAKIPAPIAEPADSPGYRVNVVSPLEKVFREDDFSPRTQARVEIAAARNEYESAQIVVEAPWRSVTIQEVRLSELEGPGGAVIPAGALKWNRVGYVETTVTPPYFAARGLGSYPDPLLPAGRFTIEQHSRAPLWLTLKTPKECPPGEYQGSITIQPEQQKPITIPLTLTVWDFALTDQTHLRTLTWLGRGALRDWYGLDNSPEGQWKQAEVLKNYQDCLLEHRLGPGGEIADHLQPGADGKFDFHEVDAALQPLISKGLNAFIMGTAPNLAREKKTGYTPEFTQQFTRMLKSYGDHLREKGWLNLAYVYVYDEAPKAAWPEVRKIDQAIHAAAPQARILQCLNDPEGVRELTGFADVFDVYVPHYQKAGVAPSQAKGAEVWLATCCYPMDHPNFFLEYPLLDARVNAWICWKHQATGFEYWSTTSWGANAQRKDGKWPQAPWIANAFGKYNGDGYLLYPGPDLQPWSSIRLEAFRDGLEDYEYLWTLNSLLQKAAQQKITGAAVDRARGLLVLDDLVKDTGAYSTRNDQYLAERHDLAEAIVAVQKLLGR